MTEKEVEIFKEKHGESPILILDDVLSELDKKRQRKVQVISSRIIRRTTPKGNACYGDCQQT